MNVSIDKCTYIMYEAHAKSPLSEALHTSRCGVLRPPVEQMCHNTLLHLAISEVRRREHHGRLSSRKVASTAEQLQREYETCTHLFRAFPHPHHCPTHICSLHFALFFFLHKLLYFYFPLLQVSHPPSVCEAFTSSFSSWSLTTPTPLFMGSPYPSLCPLQ